MTKANIWAVIAIFLFIIGIYTFSNWHVAGTIQQEAAVASVNQTTTPQGTVTAFGLMLKNVNVTQISSSSTGGPLFNEAFDEAYSIYVTQQLLSQWKQQPSLAPGRASTAVWPDHISINSAVINLDGSYTVQGAIVNVNGPGGATIGQTPVTMTLINMNGSWLISSFQQG